MATVCAPLLLVRSLTWQTTLVPTMDGQYIIKNVLMIAAAFGLAGRTGAVQANLELQPLGGIEIAAAVAPEVPSAADPVVNERHHRRSQVGHSRQAVGTKLQVRHRPSPQAPRWTHRVYRESGHSYRSKCDSGDRLKSVGSIWGGKLVPRARG